MKKSLLVLLTTLAVSVVSQCQSPAEYVIRFGGAQPPGHPLTDLQFKFKELAERHSKGEIRVKVYHSNQLGGVSEVNAAVRDGSVTMSMSSLTYIAGNYNPKYNLVNLPYLVTPETVSTLFEIMDGDIGDRLSREMEAHGFKVLGYYRVGFRHLTNDSKPIRAPEDLSGLKIRLQPNRVHIDAMRALGANPIGMDFSELYSALQQGVIDGQENPFDVIYTNKLYEVQKYCTLSGHFFDVGAYYMNLSYFERLPERLQEVVLRAGREAALAQRETAAARESEFREKLEQRMEVVELDDDGLREFKARSRPAYERIKDVVRDDALVEEFLARLR